jgi:2-polyprenyl-3-methyl-5-hydroxy-6-metoxy-1,4-benzoquinol methylase
MKTLDRILQQWRIRRALRWLPERGRVIDVGAHEGELFEAMGTRLERGFGVEPRVAERKVGERFVIEGGFFPATKPGEGGWDAITMLAVFEHIPVEQQAVVVAACHDLLREGGRVVITVPSRSVDHLLVVLKGLRLVDGMSLEEHYGFRPADLEKIFGEPRFRRVVHRRFQLGLNHLYVFEKRRD